MALGRRARARLKPFGAAGSSLLGQLTWRPILVDTPVAEKREFGFRPAEVCGSVGFRTRGLGRARAQVPISERRLIEFRVTVFR